MRALDGGARRAGRLEASLRARSQAGFSLTESMAAILLVTVVILGIAAGILTTVRATRTVSATQKAEAALSDATETIKAEPYVRCAGVDAYGPIDGATVVAVAYLDPGSDGEMFGLTCPDPAQDTAQRVSIVIGGRKADIVKRDPAVTP